MLIKLQKQIALHRNELFLLSLVPALLSNAIAQQASTDGDDKVAKVVVTGSNIKRIDVETASPVQVITRADIQRQGVTNVADLISNASASTGGLGDIGGSNSFAPGASNVSLRNLGTQSTLILVNGRRIASYGFANFTDVFSNVDSIPIDAVERVEILKSGASAIYGSDAVAGVINIITRQNFQGVELSADATKSLQSHTFGTNKMAITAGFGNLDTDKYNILVNADYLYRQNVMWTNLLKYTNPALSSISKGFGTYSSYSTPGNFDLDGSNFVPVTGCNPSLLIGGLCKYNRYSRFQAVPESDRANLYVTGTFKLGGGTEAFSEVSYSQNKTFYISPYQTYADSGSITWGNPTTGKPLTFNYLGLSVNDPFNTTGSDGVGFRYRFTDAPTYNDVVAKQFRVLAGLRGTAGQYDWESAIGVMGSKATQTQQGSFSSSGFIKEIGDYTNYTGDVSGPNAFQANDTNFFAQANGYHPGQKNSAAVLNTLFPVFGNTGKTQVEFADAKVSGSLFTMPSGDAKFALGAEVKHESMSIDPSANLLAGDIVGYGISSANSSRNIESAYTELDIPITKDLETRPALRLDKYPNLSSHFSPKIDFRYKATDALILRATVEHGFRAPNLIESAQSTKFAFDTGTTDPLRCPQATALENALFTQANNAATQAQAAALIARAEQVYNQECSFGLPDQVKNNPQLKPETSKSYTLGLGFEPIKGFSSTIDYWHIDRSNTIGLPSTAQLLSGGALPAGTTLNRATLNTATDPTFTAAEIAQYGVTAGPLQGVVRQMQNISSQRTSGIDFSIKTIKNLPDYGKFTTVFDGIYNLSYYDTSISTNSENLIGQYGYPHAVANYTLILEHNGFSNSLRFNYAGGYQTQLGQSDTAWSLSGCATQGLSATQCRVASSRTFDYGLFYTGYKNLTLGANVLNLFQQRAPADFRAFGGTSGIIPSSLQDAQGRMLRLSVKYSFE